MPGPRLGRCLVLVILVCLGGPAWAEVCKNNRIPKAKLRGYDAEATLSQREVEAALASHLPWGQPACPKLLPSREYILCYTPAHRAALWAAYQLTAADVMTRAARREAFRSDPRLTAKENAHCADYEEPKYARGHMVPDADMGRTTGAQANTYFFSNMSPQTPALNSGPWLWLERTVRDYAQRYGRVHVISGSIFDAPTPTLPSRRVGIPARSYKVLLRTGADGQLAALAIALPNQEAHFTLPTRTPEERRQHVRASDLLLKVHLVSIRELERLTGLDLLPRLDRAALKEAVASELWPRN
jgi:endonuclease G